MNYLTKTIAESNPGYLVAGGYPAEKIAVDLLPEKGVVTRGTILKRNENGLYEAANNADIAATSYLVVLDADVDTDAETEVAVDAAAYRSGHFYRGKVMLAEGAAVTSAHEVVLRGMGIVFDPLDDWTESDTTFANEPAGE